MVHTLRNSAVYNFNISSGLPYPVIVEVRISPRVNFTFTVNVKLSLYHAMKTGCGGLAPRILNLGTRKRRVVSFTSQPLWFWGAKVLPCTHWIGGWVGLSADLEACLKTDYEFKFQIPLRNGLKLTQPPHIFISRWIESFLSLSASQEILRFMTHRGSSPCSQKHGESDEWVQSTLSRYFKSALPSTPNSNKLSLRLRFFHLKFIIFPIRATCPSSNYLWLDQSNIIWWQPQIMKLLILQFSPASCYFLSIRF
jgi:hypothetical protein